MTQLFKIGDSSNFKQFIFIHYHIYMMTQTFVSIDIRIQMQIYQKSLSWLGMKLTHGMKLKPTPKIPLDRKCFFMKLSLLSSDTAKKTIFAGFSRISNSTSQSLAFV